MVSLAPPELKGCALTVTGCAALFNWWVSTVQLESSPMAGSVSTPPLQFLLCLHFTGHYGRFSLMRYSLAGAETRKPKNGQKRPRYGPRGGCGHDSPTPPLPMRWARSPATIVAILPIFGLCSPIFTLGSAPVACSRWWRARSQIGPPVTAGRPSSGPTKGIASYLAAPSARPRRRASADRCAGRPWRVRSPWPLTPIRQPCEPPSMPRLPPSGSGKRRPFFVVGWSMNLNELVAAKPPTRPAPPQPLPRPAPRPAPQLTPRPVGGTS